LILCYQLFIIKYQRDLYFTSKHLVTSEIKKHGTLHLRGILNKRTHTYLLAVLILFVFIANYVVIL